MSKKQGDSPKKKNLESKFDGPKLRQMILEGKHAEEIQKELGVVSKQSLRQHVMRLCHEDRTYYNVPGLYLRNLKRPVVNFKGEVRLTKKMLTFPGSTYSHGDQFLLEVNNEKVILTRLSEKAELRTFNIEKEEPQGEVAEKE